MDRQARIHLLFKHDGAPPTFSSYSSGILEQRLSRAIDRRKWTTSTSFSFPWFKYFTLASLGISEVYCLRYRSRWPPGLATTNTEWISDDSDDAWNFPAKQIITVQTCKVLLWSSRWTLWAFFFNCQEAVTQEICFRKPIFINFLFLYCAVDSPYVGLALHFSFILYMYRVCMCMCDEHPYISGVS